MMSIMSPLSSVLMPPPTSTIMPVIRKRETSSTSTTPSSPDEDEEYRPGQLAGSSSTANRRTGASGGRRAIAPKATPHASGPGGGGGRASTKMSREALRKANHSLIERRRREKINFALGELREMVPGLGDEKGGKAGEFKLEVLERTVIHMRDLNARILELEDRVMALGGTKHIKREKSVACDCSEDGEEHVPRRSIKRKLEAASTTTPPSPSSSPDRDRRLLSPRTSTKNLPPFPTESPDPNETEAESNLPPPLTVASRSSSNSSSTSHPSISSLLNSANHNRAQHQNQHQHQHQHQHNQHNVPQLPSSRPAPTSQATNPTLYLPFPTPSPTSPFLTYPSMTSSSSTSTTMSGPIEPSPFMAPLQNFSLFGGAISLDQTASPDGEVSTLHRTQHSGSRSPPDLSMPPPKSTRDGHGHKVGVPSSEEAANLLLAFSSPDTLRPVSGGTPVFAPHRRGTLESEDFSLDGGHDTSTTARKWEGQGQWSRPVAGKTARDILRM